MSFSNSTRIELFSDKPNQAPGFRENRLHSLKIATSEIEDGIILAEKAKNQKDFSEIEFFPTLKTKSQTEIKNDAEIKILGTAIRGFCSLEEILGP